MQQRIVGFIIALLVMQSCHVEMNEIDPMPSEPAERTVLVYMAAHNSLGSGNFDSSDLEEMRQAMASGSVSADSRVIVYRADTRGRHDLLELTARGCDTLYTYGSDVSSVDLQHMRDVFERTRAMAPARRYGLVLWSHGNGWLQNGVVEDEERNADASAIAPAVKDNITPQTWGEESGRTMNITTLARALDGQGFDYVYFDCCYMASVEVAYQLRHVTPLIVASAIELPAKGMPYDITLPMLAAPEADLVGAANATFDSYNSLTGAERTCAISVINTAALENLAGVSRRVVEASGRLTPAGYTPQRFQVEISCRFFDMQHYYEALLLTVGDDDLSTSWHAALDNCVVYKAATPGIWNKLTIDSHCGLSNYIVAPGGNPTIKGYNTLSWWNDVVAIDGR